MLRDHPAVSGFRNTGVPADEGQHLQDVVPTAMFYGGAGRFGFDARCYLDENSPLCTPRQALRLWESWRGHWNEARSVLVEKSPPNLVRMRFLQRLFPNSAFVAVVRHPIAVSMATNKSRGHDPLDCIRHWLICHQRLEADRPYLSRLFLVRYEDLIADPLTTAERTYEFLNLSPHAPLLHVRTGLNDAHFASWRDHIANMNEAKASFKSLLPKLSSICQRYGYDAMSLTTLPMPTSC